MYLKCDNSADTPVATADGDGATPLSYVCAELLIASDLTLHAYNISANIMF